MINHGYLAVDFFFVFSGFVVGYAYDDRWNKMTIGAFFFASSDPVAADGGDGDVYRGCVFLFRE